MSATSKTIVRAYTKEGYHKDILVIDSDQVHLFNIKLKGQPPGCTIVPCCPTATIYPSDFPEMVAFEVLVQEYRQ